MLKIDTHQHFWRYTSEDYGWISDSMEVLKQDYLPLHLKPLIDRQGILGTIAVQARQSLMETEWLLELAEKNSYILGITGWLNLCNGNIEAQLEEYSTYPKLKAIRHVIQDEPDPNFILRENFLHGISKLAAHNLSYEILIFQEHLPNTIKFVQKFPEQKFVIDHIAKPHIKIRQMEPWATQIREIAAFENVYCKISGMVTEADWNNWDQKQFEAYMYVVLNAFGSKRVMIGSDWPVCTLGGNYAEIMDIPSQFLEALSLEEQMDIWYNNAKSFYKL